MERGGVGAGNTTEQMTSIADGTAYWWPARTEVKDPPRRVVRQFPSVRSKEGPEKLPREVMCSHIQRLRNANGSLYAPG